MLHAPSRKPQEFGMKPTDYHLVASSVTKRLKAFQGDGKLLFEIDCLCDGQHPNWRASGGDTPPGLYKLGQVYDDRTVPSVIPSDRTAYAYGWITFDMIDLEGNEDNNYRAGICMHGGGTGLGYPYYWDAYQELIPTYGCIRLHNADLVEILELTKKGTVFVSVYQDDK